jgi:hypothetical protein
MARFAIRLVSIVLASIVALPVLLVSGQEIPEPQLPSGTTVVAAGLTNPRGFTWDADGTLFVGLGGTGGAVMATTPSPIVEGLGPFYIGMTAAVIKVVDGCPIPVATGLPSAANALSGTYGVADVAFLDGQLYALLVGGGEVRDNPDWPSGIYAVNDDGTVEIVADLSAWTRANPTTSVPWDYDPETGGFDIVAGDGLLWLSQPNRDEILTITPDGTITRVVDLSAQHPVLTGLAPAPEGGDYVGTLTTIPFPNNAAKVLHVAEDGTVTDVWTGLTTVTGIAVGPDGALYAAEMSTNNLDHEPFLLPGQGRIVRQTGPDTSEVIASNLTLPVALSFGPDGALYVGLPAIGASIGQGVILRLGRDEDAPAATPEESAGSPLAHCFAAPTN